MLAAARTDGRLWINSGSGTKSELKSDPPMQGFSNIEIKDPLN
jgi:hypothetical protein